MYRLCLNASSFAHRGLTGPWRRRVTRDPSSRHGRAVTEAGLWRVHAHRRLSRHLLAAGHSFYKVSAALHATVQFWVLGVGFRGPAVGIGAVGIGYSARYQRPGCWVLGLGRGPWPEAYFRTLGVGC